MAKVKNPHLVTQGKNVKVAVSSSAPDIDYPVFCFKHLHKDFCLDQCDQDDKQSLLEQLVKLSQLTWQQITQTHRHGMGFEKIDRNALKSKCPAFITEDINHLLAFRYNGMKPFLGHRNRFVFHIVFIERDYTLYDHG